MKTNVEESYILREYYKGFLPEQIDLISIKDKINKINRESLLQYVIDKNKEIYNIIADNYKNTYEILDKIAEKINTLNSKNNQKENEQDRSMYLFKNCNNSDDEETNNTTINIEESNSEPFSLMKINEIIIQNENNAQQIKNEIEARQNVIKNKEKMIKEKQGLIDESKSEKEFYIDNINEGFIIDNTIDDTDYELLTILMKTFLNISNRELNLNQSEDNISIEEKKFKLIQLFNKKSKKELKSKLRKIEKDMINRLSIEEIKTIKTNLNQLRADVIEIDEEGGFFYFIYKSMQEIIDIILCLKSIELLKQQIDHENEELKIGNQNLKKIQKKISNFEYIKKEINGRYENNKDKKLSDKLQKEHKNSKIETQGDEYKKDINELKLLISKMENNYVTLLKTLGRKMIKPKNLIRRPDAKFFQSKIK